jgi:hypothetical protein
MPAIRIGGGGRPFSDGAARPAALLGGNLSTTSAKKQFTDYSGQTFEDLYSYMSVHTGGFTRTVSLNDDGTDSTNLTLGHTGTGVVEDTTGTETPAANSLIDVECTGGMHNDNGTNAFAAVSFQAGGGGLVGSGASLQSTSDRYHPLFGEDANDTTVANVQTRMQRATVFSNLRAYMDTTGASTVDVSHYDGVASTNLTVSFSSSADGEAADTTGTESNSAGDDCSFFADHVSGSDQGMSIVQMDTDVEELPRGGTGNITWSTTTSYSRWNIHSFGVTDTAGLVKAAARIGSEDIGNLSLYVSAFTSATAAKLSARVNTTESTNVTVSVTGTGVVEDTTGTEAIVDADDVSFIRSASAVSGVTSRSAFIEMATAVDVVASLLYPREHPMQAHLLRR